MNAAAAFLLAFPALFSIVNPPGAAFIFHEVTGGLATQDKARLSGRVAFYSLLVMLVSLWGGAYVLNFFGISLEALRIAGGAVVALRAWELLMAPEQREARKTAQATSESGDGLEMMDGMAFFPLTMPFTTGPGTISVAVTLGAERPSSGLGLLQFFLGCSAAAVAIAILVWLAYRSAGWMAAAMGPSARRTLSRLSAFLLLCIGVQIMLTGVEEEVLRLIGLPK